MKAVVDTNVVAYFVLGTDKFAQEARACLEIVSNPIAPAHWEAELTNTLWMAVRKGVLSADEGPRRLGLARRLGIESVATATLCQGALLRAVSSGITAYDALFVELAARTGCPLVTFDQTLLRTCPDIARLPSSV